MGILCTGLQLIVALSISILCAHCQTDPCQDHLVISDIRRNVSAPPSNDPNRICDRNVIDESKWYRFGGAGNGKVTGYCPTEMMKCGTAFPMWIEYTQNATAGNIVNLKAYTSAPGDCKGWSGDVQVKNCSTFNVYKLKQPAGCDAAYCVSFPCPQGLVTIGTQCTDKIPGITNIHITGPTVIYDTAKDFSGNSFTYVKDFTMKCELEPKTNGGHEDSQTEFEVSFISRTSRRDVVVATKTLNMSTLEFVIHAVNLNYTHIGSYILCGARAYYKTTPSQKTSMLEVNTPYFIGIEELKEVQTIQVSDGVATTTKFTTTLPVVCIPAYVQSFKEPCTLPITATGVDTGSSVCTVSFQSAKWDAGQTSQKSDNSMKLTAQMTKGHTVSMGQMSFKQVSEFALTNLWNGYQPPNYIIHAQSGAVSYCNWWGDPHYTTFLGNKYEHLKEGDFWAVKNTEQLNRVFEVQVRHYRHSNGIARSCAIAAREDNHVFMYDMCKYNAQNRATGGGKGLLPSRLSPRQWQLSPGSTTLRSGNGKKFVHTFPSGSHIIIEAQGDYLRVNIYLPDSDKGKIRGLCGTWDSNICDLRYRKGDANENQCGEEKYKIAERVQPVTFYESWRIKEGTDKNYFETPPSRVTEQDTAPERCKCKMYPNGTNYFDCISENPGRSSCSGCQEITNIAYKGYKSQRFSTMSSDYDDDVIEDYEFDNGASYPPANLIWPTAMNGITKQQANTSCTTAITRSPVYTKCKDKMDESIIIDKIAGCMVEVQEADDLAIAAATTSVFQDVCINELSIQVSYNVTLNGTTDMDDDEAQKTLQEVQSAVCPNNCNGNGTCVNGTCNCNPGMTGADCAFSINYPVVIQSLQGDGLCNKRRRPCRSVRVMADNVFGDGVVCKVARAVLQANNTLSPIQNSTQILDGRFEASGIVRCPLIDTSVEIEERAGKSGLQKAPVDFLHVSISNGGHLYSSPATVTTYDEKCVDCSSNLQCRKKKKVPTATLR